jgi:hypothetical protein
MGVKFGLLSSREVFENRMLRIFGSKRDEVTGRWRRLHNEEQHNAYISPRIIRMIESRRMRWVGHIARMVVKRNRLLGKSEGKRPLGRPRQRWVDNIKMDFGEIGWGGVDQIGLAQDRDKWKALVNPVINLWVPSNAGKFSSGCTTGGIWHSA